MINQPKTELLVPFRMLPAWKSHIRSFRQFNVHPGQNTTFMLRVASDHYEKFILRKNETAKGVKVLVGAKGRQKTQKCFVDSP